MKRSIERYLASERALSDSLGLEPVEHRLELPRLGGTLRALEVGDGDPVVFIHGVMTAGASYLSLVASMPDYRCIVIDRPGNGLSEPVPERFDVVRHRLLDGLPALENRYHGRPLGIGIYFVIMTFVL